MPLSESEIMRAGAEAFERVGVDVSGKTYDEILELSKKWGEARKIASNENEVKQIFLDMTGAKTIGGKTFPLSPENARLNQSKNLFDLQHNLLSALERTGKYTKNIEKALESDFGRKLEPNEVKAFKDYAKGKNQWDDVIANINSPTQSVKTKFKSPGGAVGALISAGEVLAGEDDIGKLAAGNLGATALGALGTRLGYAVGGPVGAGIGGVGASVAGYPAGQVAYEKMAPKAVKEALKLSPEERARIKEMLSKAKKKLF